MFQPGTGVDIWSNILDIVYDLAKKKPWLREECGFILFNSVQTLSGKDPKYAQLIIDKLQTNGISKTPQGLAIWIRIQATFPSVGFPQGVWHHQDPLNRKKKSKLAKILMEAPTTSSSQNGNESEGTTKGAWSTKLQFAWDAILAELLDIRPQGLQRNSKAAKRIDFAEFWEECIDSR